MAEEIKVQESWNMGTETLKCLARCRDLCSFYSQSNKLADWYRASMDWSRNLSCFLDEKEDKELNNCLMNFPRITNDIINPNEKGTAYLKLDKFCRIALKFMKEKGLLMPKTTDPRAAVINN